MMATNQTNLNRITGESAMRLFTREYFGVRLYRTNTYKSKINKKNQETIMQ